MRLTPAAGNAAAAYIPRSSAQAIPSIDARVRLAAGAACPYCFSTLYYRKYTFWHFLIAIVTFPFGLLFLLAPVQRCENGHSYGLGKWIINIIQGLLFFVLVIVILLVWTWQKNNAPNYSSAPNLTTPAQEANSQSTTNSGTVTAHQTGFVDSPFAGLALTSVLEETTNITVTNYNCANNGDDSARFAFKSDGIGGCANWDDASAGLGADGTWLLLIPTATAASDNAFSLIYAFAYPSNTLKFLGIMPGDGHGSVAVSIEHGYIIERYHGVTRTSRYENGHVSTVSTQ